MDIVLITRDRPELTEQTIHSMIASAADWSKHRLLIVVDGVESADPEVVRVVRKWDAHRNTHHVLIPKQLGVGGAKNFGATWFVSQPSRARILGPEGVRPDDFNEPLLMFSDDDMYYLPGWDAAFEEVMALGDCDEAPIDQLGGWRHPYHQLGCQVHQGTKGGVYEVDAATGNCFVIRWSDWLRYGPFDANATGPGQSEDYALSQRIRAGGGIVATLDPPVAIHCGLVNSAGEPATGWRETEEMIGLQLASMPPEMRDEVLIMRPAPFAGVHSVPMTGAGRTQLVEADGRVEMEIDYRGCEQRAFEDARSDLGMQPRDPIHGPIPPVDLRQERTLEEIREMYPHITRYVRNAPLIEQTYSKILGVPDTRPVGLNIGSGQRRFESTREVRWINIDIASRLPDQVPDLNADARELDRYFDEGSVDLVVSHHLHEHLGCGESDPITQAAYKVLKPGGSLLVFTPDARRLAGRWLSGELDDFQFAVQMMGAYQGLESDRHRWLYTQETLAQTLDEAAPWSIVRPFDWREIPGSDLARDWYIAAVECVK